MGQDRHTLAFDKGWRVRQDFKQSRGEPVVGQRRKVPHARTCWVCSHPRIVRRGGTLGRVCIAGESQQQPDHSTLETKRLGASSSFHPPGPMRVADGISEKGQGETQVILTYFDSSVQFVGRLTSPVENGAVSSRSFVASRWCLDLDGLVRRIACEVQHHEAESLLVDSSTS